jgi:hypothetical protein
MARMDKKSLQIPMDKKTEKEWDAFLRANPECEKMSNEGRLRLCIKLAMSAK